MGWVPQGRCKSSVVQGCQGQSALGGTDVATRDLFEQHGGGASPPSQHRAPNLLRLVVAGPAAPLMYDARALSIYLRTGTETRERMRTTEEVPKQASVELRNRVSDLTRLVGRAETFAKLHGLPDAKQSRLLILLEELFLNVIITRPAEKFCHARLKSFLPWPAES
jgi:hypothetical protein